MPEPLDNIIIKARAFCALQERCISDMEEKLFEWKITGEKAGKVIEDLIKEDFINEERYARAFAGGKFRINHWGRTKISYELERRKIPGNIIRAGLEEIEEEDYEKTLEILLIKKDREVKEKDPYKRKQKLIAYAVQKGFEYETVKRVLKESGKF